MIEFLNSVVVGAVFFLVAAGVLWWLFKQETFLTLVIVAFFALFFGLLLAAIGSLVIDGEYALAFWLVAVLFCLGKVLREDSRRGK